jgi:hypothetical protein
MNRMIIPSRNYPPSGAVDCETAPGIYSRLMAVKAFFVWLLAMIETPPTSSPQFASP